MNQLKNSDVAKTIKKRSKEFSSFKNSKIEDIFKELCFCIMTANCGALKCIEVSEKINDGFLTLDELELAKKLKQLGYRFPNVRARYIIEARQKIKELDELLKTEKDAKKIRAWLVKNIKGLGLKESSHFLRNIGFFDVAIIDFHIIDLLVRIGLIHKPKSLTKAKYLEIEALLRELSEKVSLTLGELDLFLWYLETGKVLK
ncbi:MAG: N-glycosylase/DNA lyase [Promethearchaeota archaeon]